MFVLGRKAPNTYNQLRSSVFLACFGCSKACSCAQVCRLASPHTRWQQFYDILKHVYDVFMTCSRHAYDIFPPPEQRGILCPFLGSAPSLLTPPRKCASQTTLGLCAGFVEILVEFVWSRNEPGNAEIRHVAAPRPVKTVTRFNGHRTTWSSGRARWNFKVS